LQKIPSNTVKVSNLYLSEIITETLMDNSLKITQNIFNEIKTCTNIKIEHAFTFNENIENCGLNSEC